MRHCLPILLLAVVFALGCEENEDESIYRPGGTYAQVLDARGRRHVVQDANGKTLAKVRERKDGLKVYSAEMAPLGEVTMRDGKVTVSPQAGGEVTFRPDGKAVMELPKRLRIETVEHGWAIFDAHARRLGYFEWLDDGRLALRDDYAATPRVFAGAKGAEARTPAGQVMLTVSPAYPASTMLPFLLDGELDAMDRVALGMWLQTQKPQPEADGDAG